MESLPPETVHNLSRKITTRWIGSPVKRKEDLRFITGKGLFVDDFRFDNCLYVAFVRGKVAHAKIRHIETDKASRVRGVVKVLTGEEVADLVKPWPHLIPTPPYYGIAVDKIRYQGEPVAMVIAESKYAAWDAAEAIEVYCEGLRPLVTIDEALSLDAPLIHEGFPRNVAWEKKFIYGDVDGDFSRADRVARGRYYYHRFISAPLEPTALAAVYDRHSGHLTIYDQHQQAPMYHARYSRVLGIPSNRIRIRVPDLGGGFGNKQSVYPYSALIGLAALITGRPVKFVASRSEDFQALMHSPDRLAKVEAAYKLNGEVISVRMKIYDNFGAYLRHPEPHNVTRAFPSIVGPYRIKSIEIDATGVFTNTCPTGPNRGYGQQHASFCLERIIDKVAEELGLDPVELRTVNLIRRNQMPYETPVGSVYDDGDYAAALSYALELAEYEQLKREREKMRGNGDLMGLGVATIVEGGATAFGFARLWGGDPAHVAGYASMAESASVRVHPDGSITVAMGTVPQGQGHETSAAQIVADVLGVTPDDVTVIPGFDSDTHPYSAAGSGTYASRFSQIAVGALVGASLRIREKVLHIAAHKLEANPADLEMRDGMIYIRGNQERFTTFREIARIAHTRLADLPPNTEAGLDAYYTYHFPYSKSVGDDLRGNLCGSYAFLAGVAAVVIDKETGAVDLRRLVVVHDSGRALNPMILEGQLHGAVVNGIGGALLEGFEYDQEGNLLTSTFADYLPISATEVPELRFGHMETSSPFTPLGAKGSGEGGTILVPVLIANAINDALKPLGVEITTSRLTPFNVWRFMTGKGL
ncbi:MAG: xanthine dehydrogenase family protein molybdopterin-binding subunit [Thaumarchaeota archaeon]|nr:xanthine dehydrogenase family protein molybdopterin-binding subunit [Candidatus Calditenuaceae archaeon]MDW8186701.1 xanthine dehydrogenase family protein molybdopterin-binding subunit [Nitrososphaerota archaeon]